MNTPIIPVPIEKIALCSKDAAQLIGLEDGTLSNWRIKGQGPKFKKFGGRVVYMLNDLRAWAEAQPEFQSTAEVQEAS